MELIMIRHAIAEKRDAQEYPDDDQRPLSAVGRKRQRRVAKALRRMDCAPDRIITSPRVRARQTAEIMAKELGGGATMEESEALGRGYSPAAVLGLLSRFRDSETVVLVGHEPDFSALAAVLLGPDSGPEIRFKH